MTVEMQKRPFEERTPPVRVGKKIEPNASFCKSGVGLPLVQLIQHVLKEREEKQDGMQRML